MTTVTLRPNSTISAPGSVTQGSAPGATAHEVTADESDGSFYTLNSSDDIAYVGLTNPSPPAGAVSKSLKLEVRWRGPGGANAVLWHFERGVVISSGDVSLTSPFATFTSAAVPTNLTAAEINDLRVHTVRVTGGSTTIDVARIAVDWTYVAKPVVTLDAITDPFEDSSYIPVSWVNTLDSDGGAQTHYRVWVTDDNNSDAVVYDTGVVASSSTTRVVGPLANSGEYTVHVQIAQTVNGVQHWSAEDTQIGVTVDVDTAEIDGSVIGPNNAAGSISGQFTRWTGGKAWELIEVQRLDPSGWVPVRGSTLVAPNDPDTYSFTDYEATNGYEHYYRARAYWFDNDLPIVGDWFVTPSPVKWESDDVWLKVPGRPGLNTKVCMRVIPSPTYARDMGVFTPANGNRPIVVVGPQQATASGQFVIQTETDGEAAAVHAALAEPVKLLQGPPGWHRWGSRYVMTGPVTEQPLAETVNARMWTLTEPAGWSTNYVEVDRPADPDAGEV